MSTVLITGSNRGIGLEFVKQYAAAGWQVLACYRNPQTAKELFDLQQQFPAIVLLQFEATSQKDIAQLAKDLHNKPIDLLVLNAGICDRKDQDYRSVDRDNLQNTFLGNAIAPFELACALVSNVAASQLKKIIYISSNWGSITENTDIECYSYKASKAAGNCLMKNLSLELATQGIQILVLHPGWVQTDMGGPHAPTPITESVSGMREVIAKINDKSCKFYTYYGREMAW